MRISTKTLEFKTKGEFDFIDFTERVQDLIKEGQIKNGLINIQTLHTTAALFLNENEPLLLEDFKTNLERIFPKNLNYNHNDFDRRNNIDKKNECVNGHSHCRALQLPSNLTLNIVEGELQLGQWQRIFLVELDISKLRRVQVQIMGE